MHRKTAEAIFYIVLGGLTLGLMGFVIGFIYLAITNPN